MCARFSPTRRTCALQDAQQLDLHGRRHVADFIEERAAIGRFEQTGAILRRAVNEPRMCPNSRTPAASRDGREATARKRAAVRADSS
jgi:hypothetical protein